MANCRTVRIPGPQGPPGTDGADGTNGVNAYSLVAADFAIPAQQATVVVTLTDPAGNRWMAPGQIVAVQGAGTGNYVGYYGVVAKVGTTQATLQNLRDDTTGVYSTNFDGVGIIAVGMWIAPAGIQGPPGVAVAGFLEAANNLSDVDDVAASRTNLGLGALAVLSTINNGLWSGTDLAVVNGGTGASDAATARTNLGAAASGPIVTSGLTVSGSNKLLGRQGGGPGDVEEITTSAYIRTLLDDTDAAAARVTLGRVGMRYGLLGRLTAVTVDASGDTQIDIGSSRYRLDRVTLENASISLTTATAGVFTASGGGTALAADQALSALTASSKFKDLTLEVIAGTDVRTETQLWFRVATPQGAPATVNVWLWGWMFDP